MNSFNNILVATINLARNLLTNYFKVRYKSTDEIFEIANKMLERNKEELERLENNKIPRSGTELGLYNYEPITYQEFVILKKQEEELYKYGN